MKVDQCGVEQRTPWKERWSLDQIVLQLYS